VAGITSVAAMTRAIQIVYHAGSAL
jgi:hypothetical protein